MYSMHRTFCQEMHHHQSISSYMTVYVILYHRSGMNERADLLQSDQWNYGQYFMYFSILFSLLKVGHDSLSSKKIRKKLKLLFISQIDFNHIVFVLHLHPSYQNFLAIEHFFTERHRFNVTFSFSPQNCRKHP